MEHFAKRIIPECAMHQYPELSLNIFENAWINCSDYANELNVPDHLIVWQAFEDALDSKHARVLNMAQLYMQGLNIVLNMSEYGSICHNNAWICLSMP